jgi:predicted nucleotidyltransferase
MISRGQLTMSRDHVLAVLRSRYPEMVERFAVTSMWIFGSASRDELGDHSDVDVLAAFDGGATFDRYFGLKSFLEELLCRPVDLATERMVTPRLRRRIADELLHVA